MDNLDKLAPLSFLAVHVLEQLFLIGPTWDGDLIVKSGRDELYKRGLADCGNGWQWLTRDGVMMAIGRGLDREKEQRQRDRSIPS